MNFGALIIGDEILSGKRVDAHFRKIASLLGETTAETKLALTGLKRAVSEEPEEQLPEREPSSSGEPR